MLLVLIIVPSHWCSLPSISGSFVDIWDPFKPVFDLRKYAG